MKFGCYVLVASCTTTISWGFLLSSPKLYQQKVVALSSAVQNSSSDLVPPPKLDELLKDESSTKDLYESHVQKTYGRYPLTMEKGDGCRLTTSDGKEYLDFVSGIATCALGHGNKELSKAISDQMESLHHVSNLYLIPAQAALATWICDNSCAEKVFFCNSGAESNEAAIKLARRHASNRGISKPVIITAHQSFHGRTLAALTATAQPKYHKGFGYGDEMVPGFEYVQYNDGEDLQRLVQEIADDPERGLAAIMLEAIQGEGGIIVGEDDFFVKARQLCDEQNALLMCDEVQVGMGRTGRLWGYQHLSIEPDVFTSAKALGGGVPIGAMCAKGEAATVFGPGDHASTYGGNPLACRAGLAVADYMSKHNLLQNVQDRGEQLRQGLEALVEKYPAVFTEVRGRGLLQGIVTATEELNAGAIVSKAMEVGQLLLVPAGPNVVRFVPPLTVTEEEVQEALEKTEATVLKILSEQENSSP